MTTFTIKAIIIPQKMILICYKNNFTFCRWTKGRIMSCTAVGAIHHGTVSQKEGNYCSSGMRVVFKPLHIVPARESRRFSVVMVTGVNRYFGYHHHRHTPVMVVGSGSEGAHGEEGEGKGRKGPSDHGITAPLHNLTQEICSRHQLKYSTCTAAEYSSTGWTSTAAEDRCGTTVPRGILYTNSPGFLRLRRIWSL